LRYIGFCEAAKIARVLISLNGSSGRKRLAAMAVVVAAGGGCDAVAV